jgi:flagellar basal body rod protein FlgB
MPLNAASVVDQVSAALNVSSLRHQVVASNIAHRDTVGYQRLALQFAHAWQRAGEAELPSARVVAELPAPGAAAPSIEQDLLTLSGNATHYQALTRSLSRYFAMAGVVATGGRG